MACEGGIVLRTSEEAKKRFEREKQAYWQQRDELLKQYNGKWVAIVGGQVAGVADQMNKAAAAAFRKTGSEVMYVTLVGHEDIVLRVRQSAKGHYDPRYAPPMPVVGATVSDLRERVRTAVTFVVDTGSDLTLLRAAVADELDLWDRPAGEMVVAGLGSPPELRPLYNAVVHIAGQGVSVTADCRSDIDEDLLGRDVINEFALTLCAKRDQVQFEWVEEKPA